MSLKQEIETWVTALGHYDNNEFDEALRTFDAISDTSKILFNCGMIHATLGEHGKAVECYQRAVRLDQYLAVAYFQQGVSNFLMGDFEEALANFNDTLLYLRGNNHIAYEQLGLKFKLYSCEVLFNRGLCYIYLQQKDAGMQDLSYATKEKMVPDHDVIDEAITEQAEGYTVFSIPVGVIYRPNEAKVKNLKTKDYLGKARLVAASDRSDTFTGFTGSELKRMIIARDDRPEESRSYAATNLVKPGLTSRTRQQSAPPVNRTMFPPTPPPEADRPPAARPKRESADSASTTRSAKPRALDLSVAGFEQPAKPRLGTVRSASERPRPSRQLSDASTRSRDTGVSRSTRAPQEPPLRRISGLGGDADSYTDELYDMYSSQMTNPAAGRRRSRSRRPMYIEEEREEDEESYGPSSSLNEADFEMIPQRGNSSHPPPRQRSRSRATSRRPEVRKVRVKVHAEDTRYVMLGGGVVFRDFVEQVRGKFGIRGDFKVKMKDDEGDMVTLGDQDDLELAVKEAKAAARREKSDMAKMEVWVQEL